MCWAQLRRSVHGGDGGDHEQPLALVFLSLAYAAILLQQPNLCAVCLDTGRRHAGTVYNLPFVPMVVTLAVGAVLWLKIDPAHQIFEEVEARKVA